MRIHIAALIGFVSILAGCSSGTHESILPQSQSAVLPLASAQHRSFADFLASQGTYCVPPSTGVPTGAAVVDNCVIYVPYAPNFIGFAVATPAPFCADYTLGAVDYAGLANAYIVSQGGKSLGTTVTGTVNERRLADGSGVVSVVMNTHNALAWGGCDPTRTLDFATATVLFGARPDDVLHGATPALANAALHFTYAEAHYGDPFPDFIALNFGVPGYAWKTQGFHASASGPLTAAFGVAPGTPGQMVIGQNGTFKTVGKAAADGFTAEFIHITQK